MNKRLRGITRGREESEDVKIMIFRHARYLNEDFQLVFGDIEIADGKILRTGEKLPFRESDLVVDCEGYTLVPGFVDIHIHGCNGGDACDGDRKALDDMAGFLLTKGVTSFCPTVMTTGKTVMERAVDAALACAEKPLEDGARVVGLHLEGPFISKEKKGAQLESAIVPPDFLLFQELYHRSAGLIRLVVAAPEMPGAIGFGEKASEFCTVSVAHTTASYEKTMEAFQHGFTHVTHLFNAMTGFSHRAPGVVGAAFDQADVTAELICDGFHLHPAVLRTAFRLLGDRAVVVSDAMRATGLPDGKYDLGGQAVNVEDGKATLNNGTIAGSVTNLHQEIKNLVGWGVPLEQAVKAATLTPAKVIGKEGEIGSIAPGKRADLVVLDENLEIMGVYH